MQVFPRQDGGKCALSLSSGNVAALTEGRFQTRAIKQDVGYRAHLPGDIAPRRGIATSHQPPALILTNQPLGLNGGLFLSMSKKVKNLALILRGRTIKDTCARPA